MNHSNNAVDGDLAPFTISADPEFMMHFLFWNHFACEDTTTKEIIVHSLAHNLSDCRRCEFKESVMLGAAGLLDITMEPMSPSSARKMCTHPFTARQAHTSNFSELGEVALHLVLVKTVRYPPKVDNTSINRLLKKKSVYETKIRMKDTSMVLLSPRKLSPNTEIVFCHSWESTDVDAIFANSVIV